MLGDTLPPCSGPGYSACFVRENGPGIQCQLCQGGRRCLPVDEASLSVEELIARRKQESMKRDGLQLVHVLRVSDEADGEGKWQVALEAL